MIGAEEWADRRLAGPWRAVEAGESVQVHDASGMAIAYLYYSDNEQRRGVMRRLTREEAWRIANAIVAALPNP